ncbi:hypothetical protein L6164_002125 [Bauhinia variegata]|uniref:Uncharacterized protein n=1 Tax=Bauhinia variegata TaxID=167791 RepID=A0ACB9PWQ8_BAUVA|nr:hypothetical protein L6164_002125 [Bauhinia variegata]
MTSIHVLFLLSLVICANELQAKRNGSEIISLGSFLYPDYYPSYWLSASGCFAFGFYQQGNGFAIGIWLVGKPENTTVWTANRDNPPVSAGSSLELTRNGMLVLRTEQETVLVADVSESAAYASMLDSGNFVLYGEDSEVIWESFDFPTDTILGGQNLTLYSDLISSKSESDHSSGRFRLRMQIDGNLVAYPINNTLQEDSYWSSDTSGLSIDKLSLDLQGFLCLYFFDGRFHALANGTFLAKNTTTVHRATLDKDGNFRLYKHLFSSNGSSTVQLVWSALHNSCEVKGICGFNSYCSNIGDKAVCRCLHGFVSEDNNMFQECKQNNSIEDCLSLTDPKMFYDVVPLDNISWSNNPYLVVSMEKEACGKSCLEDCDCGIASYVDGKCIKYKLPLRYGKQTQKGPAMALVKVCNGKPYLPINPNEAQGASPTDNKTSLILILVVTLGSISCIFLGFAMFVFFSYRHQVCRYRKLSGNANLEFTKECSLRSFSFDELVNYTELQKQITLGSSLSPTTPPTSWCSPSGRFAFGFYQQGAGFAVGIWLVGKENNTVVWTANRDDNLLSTNAKLQLTKDGKLLVQTEQGQGKLVANETAASSASMLDSGNFVLYGKNSNVIWQSFDHPTDTMLGGQRLSSGQQLISGSSGTNHSSGRFRLLMQGDGNLVLYPVDSLSTPRDAYWSSGTFRGPFKYLYLNKTGDLRLEVAVQSCGVIDDGCEVKGFCGLNSYCTLSNKQPYCHCLPGCDFIDQNDITLGCRRNFSESDCIGGKENAALYYMFSIENVTWD